MTNQQQLLAWAPMELGCKQPSRAAAVGTPLSFKNNATKLKHAVKLQVLRLLSFHNRRPTCLAALTPSHLSTKVFFRLTTLLKQKRKLKHKTLNPTPCLFCIAVENLRLPFLIS